MVRSEKRTRTKVSRYVENNSPKGNFMSKPKQIAATRIPVPVAESQLTTNTASSGLVGFSDVGSGTTGKVRATDLSRYATATVGAERLFADFLKAGIPQIKTKTLSKIHEDGDNEFVPGQVGAVM